MMIWPARGSSMFVADDDAVLLLCKSGLCGSGWVSEGVSRHLVSAEAVASVASEICKRAVCRET